RRVLFRSPPEPTRSVGEEKPVTRGAIRYTMPDYLVEFLRGIDGGDAFSGRAQPAADAVDRYLPVAGGKRKGLHRRDRYLEGPRLRGLENDGRRLRARIGRAEQLRRADRS